MTRFFQLAEGSVPWGDYGHILLAGTTAHLARKRGLLQLERTAPFVPPLAISGINDLVVTDKLNRELERSGLTGFSFRPVIKAHVVHLNWETWDATKDDPAAYPDSGEPEDYILHRPHSRLSAWLMGRVWEMVICGHAAVETAIRDADDWKTESPPDPDEFSKFCVLQSTWDGSDVFCSNTVRYTYLTERAENWLEPRVGHCISFKRA